MLNVTKKPFKFPWKFCLCRHAWINQWFHNKSCLLWWPVSLSIRIQTTICFYPVWTSKKMFFSSEHEFKKALRDILMRVAWYELLSTMANCGKIATFLCLGISIITWVIILKQLFASGSWILLNIPFDFVSGNIHQYSLHLRRIIVKYCVISLANFHLLFNLLLIRSSTARGSSTSILSQ